MSCQEGKISPLLIEEGNFVILKSENVSRLVQVSKVKPVYYGKQKILLGQIIGHKYGSSFEIKDKHLHYIENPQHKFGVMKAEEGERPRDNRNIVDDGKSQKLTKDEIEAFKSEGVSGEQIIESLVENSTTFKEKTPYAQVKYLKKKQKKYMNYVRVLHPTTRLLAEMYYSQGPLKICNLRIDSLAQLLAMTNVMSGGQYMVVDYCLGMIVAAVLERLGQSGCIIQLYPGFGPVSSYRQAVHALNLPKHILETLLFGLPLYQAINLLHPSVTHQKSTSLDDDDGSEQESVVGMDVTENENKMSDHEGKEAVCQGAVDKEEERNRRRAERQKEHDKAKEILQMKKMDGLLIVCKHHPTNILLELINFLAPSRPFAVFSMYQPPLIDCYVKLKERDDAIFLKITETWLRKYQVLPERTHPDITMSGSGGYLLTGIKVASKKS